MLEDDPHALHDQGIDRLGEERKRLRRRCLASYHPMAAEGVHWLDGASTVHRWVADA